jgi:hypothetical protein
LRATEVEVTKFVGSRNDGGHWITLEPGAQPTRAACGSTPRSWRCGTSPSPTERYPDPATRFRRDLPDGAGGFAANPDWVAADVSDDDEITVDGLGRKLTITTTFVTFDAQGDRVEGAAHRRRSIPARTTPTCGWATRSWR